MKNVTITLDEETAAWVRVYAARLGVSVSRVVGEMLHERMVERRDYETAMQRFLAAPDLDLGGGPYPPREDLHDRRRLR